MDLNNLDELSLDLRISLLYSCFQSKNYSRIIKELPSKFCTCYSSNIRKPNLHFLKQTLKHFPPINNIKKSWIDLNEECRALIEWFITSTPMKHEINGLSFLPKPDFNDDFALINCKYQFIINRRKSELSDSKYQQFIQNKEKFGSVIAYHGSPTYNWHAIILSNTKQMQMTYAGATGATYLLRSPDLFGVIFGDGSYKFHLTNAISLSRSFSLKCKTWNKSKLGTSLSCVGVFEIALNPQYVEWDRMKDKKMKAPCPKHYYVKDNRCIEMRGILVWTCTQTKKEEEHKTKLGLWLIALYVIFISYLLSYLLSYYYK